MLGVAATRKREIALAEIASYIHGSVDAGFSEWFGIGRWFWFGNVFFFGDGFWSVFAFGSEIVLFIVVIVLFIWFGFGSIWFWLYWFPV